MGIYQIVRDLLFNLPEPSSDTAHIVFSEDLKSCKETISGIEFTNVPNNSDNIKYSAVPFLALMHSISKLDFKYWVCYVNSDNEIKQISPINKFK